MAKNLAVYKSTISDTSAMTDNIRQFIVQLLLEKGPLPGAIPIDDYRYFDAGHIDSLGFIKFIFRIEEQFHIQFLPTEIGGPEIRTVGGLVRLINDKMTA